MEYPFYAEYPAVYRDAHGEEHTVIRNDGRRLRMVIRGIEFTTSSPDGFEPPTEMADSDLSEFCINRIGTTGELCGCEIDYEVPMLMATGDGSGEGILGVHLKLGQPAERGWLDHTDLAIRLRFRGINYSASGKSDMFEYELLEIQTALPDGVYMKACINCAFSDYSPYGSSWFGSLHCFRDNKAAYLAVRTKDDVFQIWDTNTECVQETYLCPEFERRVLGTGYRG